MPFDEINREFSFPLQKIIDEQKLEVIYMPEDGENTLISDHEINRPGLQFAGFYEYFDKQRIQVLGKTEWAYLNTLEPEVREHEPMMALDGTGDGLKFYRRIAKEAGAWLKPGGAVYLEIGYDQGKAVSELLSEAGFDKVRVVKDLPGKDRVVCGIWPG